METTAEATNKKNKVAPIIAGVLFLIIIGFVASKVIHGMNYEETDNAQLEANIVPVSSRISSFVEKIYVQDNQFVKKGRQRLGDRQCLAPEYLAKSAVRSL